MSLNDAAYNVLNHPALRAIPETQREWQEYNRMILGGVLSKIADNGILSDVRAIPQGVLSNRSSVMLTGALTATDDSGTPTINIAAHTVTYSFGDVTYNSGSVVVSNFEDTYYVFAQDERYEGGAVTYFAFESPDDGVVNEYRYVGAVITPALGGGDTTGGSGGNYGQGVDDPGSNPWP